MNEYLGRPGATVSVVGVVTKSNHIVVETVDSMIVTVQTPAGGVRIYSGARWLQDIRPGQRISFDGKIMDCQEHRGVKYTIFTRTKER